ncbi:uncharacterized protein LOC123447405 [Hordeum vulgare subsp. vulgare]|uniref:Uncharacterized protein n=1 Tax=Hordeum vulgare subsp. vulgare TaxID=112509 RepID=A0A8I6Y4Q7_HORVV|nr:uncharacterized protein LOC123447405 [Hordeum vulgare subsp. vulgare]
MGKGKVHPSPPAAAAGETAEGVLLRLLPAVVLAMAAPLGPEGKEVLAYLVLASLRSSAPPTPAREELVEGCGRKPHRPELGCGCFGCYTAYWSRWDGSPERDREAIHRAIEAFDEHLARKEEGKGVRRRKKRAASSKGKAKAPAAVDPPLPEQGEASAAAARVPAEVVDGGEEEVRAVEEEEATTAACARDDVPEERRRRVWGAVAGVFNWRGWGLWGSHSSVTQADIPRQ